MVIAMLGLNVEALFIWDNHNGDCLKTPVDYDDYGIKRPYRIDQIINKKCKGYLIDVCVGYMCSIFFVICD